MARTHTEQIAGFGMLPVPGHERRGEDLEALTRGAVLTRGLGRSYGDSSLPPPSAREVVATPLADRLLSFDPQTAVIRAEAGLSLATLNRLMLPRGFFPPVTPGTKFVTIGGMVASDVHGKNHHVRGTFGRHVRALKLRVADGRVLECSRSQEQELFLATLGGMGLTGHILEVEFELERISSPWIYGESAQVPDIDAYLAALKDAAGRFPQTVGWIDCVTTGKRMGRGIISRGRWASADEAPKGPPPEKRKLALPFLFPSFTINPLSVRAFNTLYFGKHGSRPRAGVLHPDAWFYPLDAVTHWNWIYGRRGFTQHQCVLPESAGLSAVRGFLELLTRKGGASFLCVIKDCGEEGDGLLSFPLRGTSIAVDFAVRDDTQALVDALNEYVIAHGGRVYLTKDAFTRREHFAAMEPRLPRFLEIRRKWDPEGRIKSAQSVRLLGDPP